MPSWVTGVEPLWLGYRTKEGGDSGLDASLAGRLTVHSANITGPQDAKVTTFLAALRRECRRHVWRQRAVGASVRQRGGGEDTLRPEPGQGGTAVEGTGCTLQAAAVRQLAIVASASVHVQRPQRCPALQKALCPRCR